MNAFRCLVLAGMIAIPVLPLAGVGQEKPKAEQDYSAELPRIAPRSPREALKTFRLSEGFRLEIIASEPLIRSPVACDFDENGRLFVVEYPEYNQYANPKFQERGCVKMLEDIDGDGVYDRSTVYVDNLDSPVAVACWDGGVFVGAVPDILYCKDTKGDGKADLRKKVYTGFARDHAGEAMLNSFRWAFDNRFHISTNLAGGLVRRVDDATGQTVNVRGQGFVFDPRTLRFELTSGGGQHGMSLDDWGQTYVCDNSNPIHTLMYDARYLARNPYVQAPAAAINIAPEGKYTRLYRISPNEPWRILRTRLRSQGVVPGSDEGGKPSGFFTGATGITVYRGDAWPEAYRGNLFVGEVSGNLVYRARTEVKGLNVSAIRADRDQEFLASLDNWFRPVQFAAGPDGCLYVVDMYRELIEGAAFLPPQILKHLDVSSGIDRGRIYRIAHGATPVGERRRPALGKAPTAALVALMEHADGWQRDTASRLLYQRQDRAAIAPLRVLARQSPSSLGKLHALYALQGMNALEEVDVIRALDDLDPRLRVQALRLAESFETSPTVRAYVLARSEDPEPKVRYQVAFTLGSFRGAGTAHALAALASRDAADVWMRLAILTSAHSCSGELFGLLSNQSSRSSLSGKLLLAALATQIGAADRAEDVAAVVKAIEALPETEKPLASELVRALVSKGPRSARERLTGATGGKAGVLLGDYLRTARATAAQETRPAAERAAAIRTLALGSFAEVQPLLRTFLSLQQPQPVQAATLEILARYEDPGVPSLILDAWLGLSPQLRATAAETLFARPMWLGAFLDAVEAGRVKAGDVDPARIQLLQASTDTKIRARAERLFKSTRLSAREDVVRSYQKALTLPGDTTRGKAVFKKECSACHRLEGIGESVGADLTAIRDRGLEAVLLNILDPNREVKPQFLSYYLETKTGRALTGMITTETATGLTIRRADGTSETILRVDIVELRSTGLSFMPEGLEKQVDPAAMADLLAYLNSIK